MTANGCRCIGDNKKQANKETKNTITATTITLHSQGNKKKAETQQNWNKKSKTNTTSSVLKQDPNTLKG